MENGFDQKELQGRKLFKDFTEQYLPEITSLRFTPETFNPIDGYMVSGNTYCTIEIKTREFNHNHPFSKKGWILERDKYNELMQGLNPEEPTQERALYVCIFFDAIVIYDISEMHPVFVKDHFNKTKFTRQTKLKDVVYLPLSAATYIYKGKFDIQ